MTRSSDDELKYIEEQCSAPSAPGDHWCANPDLILRVINELRQAHQKLSRAEQLVTALEEIIQKDGSEALYPQGPSIARLALEKWRGAK